MAECTEIASCMFLLSSRLWDFWPIVLCFSVAFRDDMTLSQAARPMPECDTNPAQSGGLCSDLSVRKGMHGYRNAVNITVSYDTAYHKYDDLSRCNESLLNFYHYYCSRADLIVVIYTIPLPPTRSPETAVLPRTFYSVRNAVQDL